MGATDDHPRGHHPRRRQRRGLPGLASPSGPDEAVHRRLAPTAERTGRPALPLRPPPVRAPAVVDLTVVDETPDTVGVGSVVVGASVTRSVASPRLMVILVAAGACATGCGSGSGAAGATGGRGGGGAWRRRWPRGDDRLGRLARRRRGRKRRRGAAQRRLDRRWRCEALPARTAEARAEGAAPVDRAAVWVAREPSAAEAASGRGAAAPISTSRPSA